MIRLDDIAQNSIERSNQYHLITTNVQKVLQVAEQVNAADITITPFA